MICQVNVLAGAADELQQQQLSLKMGDTTVAKNNNIQCLNDKIKDISTAECMLYKNEMTV
jgi:hypothetical protein